MRITKRQLRKLIKESIDGLRIKKITEQFAPHNPKKKKKRLDDGGASDKFFDEEISRLNDDGIKYVFLLSHQEADKDTKGLLMASMLRALELEKRKQVLKLVRKRTGSMVFDKALIKFLKLKRNMK